MFSPKISLIAAIGPDGAIGRAGGLIIPIAADLKYFKTMTWGKPVVMGRKTFESIPEKFRPLPGRQNIILTRDSKWKAEGVEVASTFADVLNIAKNASEIMIIGGGEIYNLTMPLAHKLYITQIHEIVFDQSLDSAQRRVLSGFFKKMRGDAVFPAIDETWRETSRAPVPDVTVRADWVIYERA